MVELLGRPPFFDPVLALLRHELFFGHDFLVRLLVEMVVVIAAVAERQQRYGFALRSGVLSGPRRGAVQRCDQQRDGREGRSEDQA